MEFNNLSGDYSNNLYDILNNPDIFTEKNDYIVKNEKPKIIDTPFNTPLFSGKLIKNNTPEPVFIYRIDEINGAKIKPGKLIGVNKIFSVTAPINTLFQLTNADDNNLGIIYPSAALQYVSDVSILHTPPISKKSYKKGTIVNDTKSEITFQWFDDNGNIVQDGIVVKPNDSWKFKHNAIYRITDSNDNVLGTFLPISDIINYVSTIDYIDSSDDSLLVTGGISSKKFNRTSEDTHYIITNDYNEPLSIFPKNQETFVDKPEIILPGETWEISTKNNNIYKIETEDGKCLGTFLPSKNTTNITDVINITKETFEEEIATNTSNEKKVETFLLTDSLVIAFLLIILIVIIEIACFNFFNVSEDSIFRTKLD